MSDTPRTDAEVARIEAEANAAGNYTDSHYFQMMRLARDLEREGAFWKEEYDRIADKLGLSASRMSLLRPPLKETA